MNKSIKTIVKLLALALLLSTLNSQLSTLFAQGTAFTYQGRLNDGANPANGSYDLTFTLFGANSGGSTIAGPLTNSATAVTNGLFTVMLDFGNQFPGTARWLEIGVRTNGAGAFSTLSPRQPLTSTPYAIQSANAANAASASSVAAANISGTLTTTQLPTSVVTNGASGVNISGTFSGNGAGVTNVPGTTPWQTVPGTNVAAASNQGYLLTNSSPTAVTLPTTANAGDIVTVSGNGGSGWQVLTASGQVIVDQNSQPIWTSNNNSPAANWSSLASSADGAKIVAVINGGQIYTSTNSGVTWSANTNAPAASWTSVASSADGTSVVAVANGGQIYTSGDSGSHWSLATNVPTASWTSVASSADGTRLLAVGGTFNTGSMYGSTNSGATWSSYSMNGIFAFDMVSVASSADGTKLVATGEYLQLNPNSYQGGAIFTSTNSGLNWIARSPNQPNTPVWGSVASSLDGTKLVAVYGTLFTAEGQIATSANSGAAWSINANFSSVRSVSSSADGSRLVAVTHGGGIYTSRDSGVTWLSDNAPATNWITVASSADGTRLVAAVSGGQIWTSVAGIGTAFAGTAGTTAQFQYLGNGAWQPVRQSASQLFGTLPTASLPANVVTNTETGVTLSGTFSGNGAALTSLSAANVTGVLATTQLPASVVTNGATGVSITGTFSGNGAGVTNVPGTMPWQPVAGTNVAAAANQGYLLTNPASTTLTLPTNANVGSIVTVSGEGSSGWQVVAGSGQVVKSSSWTSYQWTNYASAPVTNWSAMASSSDGNKLVAGGHSGEIYTSTNSGVTWSAGANAFTGNWTSLASSADGTKLAAAGIIGIGMITSTNSGATWSGAPGITWHCVASSANGSRLVAGAVGSRVYLSTDWGINWSQLNASPFDTLSVASSADGAKLVAVAAAGSIYTSADSGVTWSANNNALSNNWICVASSADGTKLAAAASGGGIITSADSGVTWSTNNNAPFTNWNSVASSAEGTKLVAANAGGIYTSLDSGVTWSANSNGPVGSSVVSSADGSKMAAISGTQIWTAQAIYTSYSGTPGATAQFQYLGNGLWQPVGEPVAGTYTGSVTFDNIGNSFTGNGSGLTALNASQLTIGTVPASALAGANGGGLTNLNASQLTGIVADARLSTNIALRSGGNTFSGNQFMTNGNVGIGTTTPANKLDVQGSADFSGNVGIGTPTPTRMLQLGGPSNTEAMMRFASTASDNSAGRAWEIGVPKSDTNTSGKFYSFVIDDTGLGTDPEFLIQFGTGNVGIGTTNPAARLDVSGSANVSGLLSANSLGVGTNDSTVKVSIAGVTNYNSGLKLTGSSANGTGLALNNTAGGGHQFSLFSSGTNNSIGAGGFAIYDDTAVRWCMVVTSNGNVGIGMSGPTNTLHVAGGVSATAFVTTSDRNAKENFAPVSPSEVLDKVSALPITSWNYKTMNDGRHMGPMAQDFYAAFHLGGGDTTITTIDPDGVALAAIQGLNKKLEEKLEQKETEITQVKQQLNELRHLVESMNHKQNEVRK